jgi:hypothetical protein
MVIPSVAVVATPNERCKMGVTAPEQVKLLAATLPVESTEGLEPGQQVRVVVHGTVNAVHASDPRSRTAVVCPEHVEVA